VGVLYILDEPSIGLHQRDNARLLATLEQLRDLGNTVIVVEHDEETMRAADHVIDMGPGAGKHGGEVIASGTVEEIIRNPRSITGKFLSGESEIAVPAQRRPPDSKRAIRIQNAREHNLKNVNAEIPLGLFVAVTGVSGSGKSTLIEDILHQSLARHFYRARVIPGAHDRITGLEHIDKVIDIDQSPIGRTPRSNPATYTGLFTPIRELFEQGRRHLACRARDKDDVVRGIRRPAKRAVRHRDLHVGETQAPESLRCMLGERRLPLERDHVAAHAAQHRRLVARPCAHLERDVIGLRGERLGHQRDHQRLRDRLAAVDGERAIFVGVTAQPWRKELLTGNLAHRLQHARVSDPVRQQLLGHHPLSGCAHYRRVQSHPLIGVVRPELRPAEMAPPG